MAARQGTRSNKKGTTGRGTPKGRKPAETGRKGGSVASGKSEALPRPVLDQRLKRQGAKFGAHDTSRSGRRGGLRVPPVTEVMTFTGDAVLDLPGSPAIIHVPGHTPGSVAIHVPSLDALFVGDALTTGHVLTGKKGPQPAPFTLEPEVALASLTRLEGIQASWLLPGHGAPWRGAVAYALGQVRTAAAA